MPEGWAGRKSPTVHTRQPDRRRQLRIAHPPRWPFENTRYSDEGLAPFSCSRNNAPPGKTCVLGTRPYPVPAAGAPLFLLLGGWTSIVRSFSPFHLPTQIFAEGIHPVRLPRVRTRR